MRRSESGRRRMIDGGDLSAYDSDGSSEKGKKWPLLRPQKETEEAEEKRRQKKQNKTKQKQNKHQPRTFSDVDVIVAPPLHVLAPVDVALLGVVDRWHGRRRRQHFDGLHAHRGCWKKEKKHIDYAQSRVSSSFIFVLISIFMTEKSNFLSSFLFLFLCYLSFIWSRNIFVNLFSPHLRNEKFPMGQLDFIYSYLKFSVVQSW